MPTFSEAFGSLIMVLEYPDEKYNPYVERHAKIIRNLINSVKNKKAHELNADTDAHELNADEIAKIMAAFNTCKDDKIKLARKKTLIEQLKIDSKKFEVANVSAASAGNNAAAANHDVKSSVNDSKSPYDKCKNDVHGLEKILDSTDEKFSENVIERVGRIKQTMGTEPLPVAVQIDLLNKLVKCTDKRIKSTRKDLLEKELKISYVLIAGTLERNLELANLARSQCPEGLLNTLVNLCKQAMLIPEQEFVVGCRNRIKIKIAAFEPHLDELSNKAVKVELKDCLVRLKNHIKHIADKLCSSVKQQGKAVMSGSSASAAAVAKASKSSGSGSKGVSAKNIKSPVFNAGNKAASIAAAQNSAPVKLDTKLFPPPAHLPLPEPPAGAAPPKYQP